MIKLKTKTETVPLSISLMGDLLGESVSTSKRGEYKKAKTKIADMTPEEKRAYDAQKKAESRAKAAAEKKEGKVAFTGDNVREALADAALMLLASGREGSQHIEAYLSKLFADKPAAVLNIKNQARKGKLKPRLLKVISQKPQKPTAAPAQTFNTPKMTVLDFQVGTSGGGLRNGREVGGQLVHAIRLRGYGAICGHVPAKCWHETKDDLVTCKKCSRMMYGFDCNLVAGVPEDPAF